MALKPTAAADKTDGADNTLTADAAAANAQKAELDGLNEQLTAKATEILTLQEQLAAAQAKGEKDLRDQEDGHKATVLDLNNKLSDLEGKLNKANTELAEAKAAASGKAPKEAKAKIISVISLTDYSYMVDGDVRVSPDKPSRCEWRPGNLLDAQMEAKLIGLYDPEAEQE